MDADAVLAESIKLIMSVSVRECMQRWYIVEYAGDVAAYVETVKKVTGIGKTIVLDCTDVEAAKAALEVCKAEKPILDGANASNYEAMVEVAKAAGVVLGVSGASSQRAV